MVTGGGSEAKERDKTLAKVIGRNKILYVFEQQFEYSNISFCSTPNKLCEIAA